MNKEKTRGGVHIKERGNVALPTDMVKVLKTQDENYVRTARAAGLKKIDKIKGQLTAMVDLLKPSPGQDDMATNDQLDAVELPQPADARASKGEADEEPTESTSARKKLLLELRARLHRDKMLRYTQREFEMQRLMMGKGTRQKIQGTEKVGEADSDEEDDPRSRKGGRRVVDEQAYKPRVYKWRRERKR
ncbi:small-subunit processome [Salix suchowensis]|nr:small-subunit processome [Salix suchowensis]